MAVPVGSIVPVMGTCGCHQVQPAAVHDGRDPALAERCGSACPEDSTREVFLTMILQFFNYAPFSPSLAHLCLSPSAPLSLSRARSRFLQRSPLSLALTCSQFPLLCSPCLLVVYILFLLPPSLSICVSLPLFLLPLSLTHSLFSSSSSLSLAFKRYISFHLLTNILLLLFVHISFPLPQPCSLTFVNISLFLLLTRILL